MTFTIRKLLFVVFGLAFVPSFLVPGLRAQYASPPQTYSMTLSNSTLPVFSGMTITIYRDGSKVLMDQSRSPTAKNPKGFHVRTLRDLQAHKYWSWYPDETSSPCGAGTFSGDWGDPFDRSSMLSMTVGLPKVREVGIETMNGIATKVFEGKNPQGGGGKLWLDTKYGLIIKSDTIAKNGQHQTMQEVKEFSLAKPPASVFALPPACASAPITGHSESTPGPGGQITSHAEAQIGLSGTSAQTPGNADDFVDAVRTFPSRNSCTALFRVVRAGTMEPITSGFRIWLNGHEVTAQMRDGVLRIDNVPPEFNMGANFGNASAAPTIHRQCFRPQTVLLLVVKNPEHLLDGTDWLWVKAGKFATVSAPTATSESQKGPPQNAPSQKSASQIDVPTGTQVGAKYEDGTEVKLKPEEQVGLLFVNDISGMEEYYYCHTDKPCSLDELIKAVKGEGLGRPPMRLSRDPNQDPNYHYTVSQRRGDIQVEAIPRRAGLGGFLFIGHNHYYNPNGAASMDPKDPFGHTPGEGTRELWEIYTEGETFTRFTR